MMMDESSPGLAHSAEDEEPFVNEDVTKLIRAWRNEKYSPELLPFAREVAEGISEVCEFVGEALEEDRSDKGLAPDDPEQVLRQKELERTKYMLRDYLRIRLWKIGRYPQHYLEPANLEKLSDAERTYLREAWELKKTFFEHRLLGALPKHKQGLDDQIDLHSMVRRPELDKQVYVKALADVGQIELPPTFSQEASATTDTLNLIVGQTYLMRYSLVRKFLVNPNHIDVPLVQLV
jgi:GINS complex subunit 4